VYKVAIALAAATLAACHFKPDLPPSNETLFSMAQPVAYETMGQCVGAHAKDVWGASVENYPRGRLVRVVIPSGAELLVRPESSGSSVDLLYFHGSAGNHYELEAEGRRIVNSCRALPPPPPSPYRQL
jgi:hypothetical protein